MWFKWFAIVLLCLFHRMILIWGNAEAVLRLDLSEKDEGESLDNETQ